MHSTIKDLIFTPSCIGCNRLGYALCNPCSDKLKPVIKSQIPNLNLVLCANDYEGWLRDRVVDYKSGNYQLGRGLAEVLLDKCLNQIAKPIIVPIPTSRQKLIIRQIDTMGHVAKQLRVLNRNIQVMNSLKLIKAVQEQVGLSQIERAKNVSGAFACIGKVPSHVILLDDVITTGATMSQAAYALRQAGAKTVFGIGLCASTKLH